MEAYLTHRSKLHQILRNCHLGHGPKIVALLRAFSEFFLLSTQPGILVLQGKLNQLLQTMLAGETQSQRKEANVRVIPHSQPAKNRDDVRTTALDSRSGIEGRIPGSGPGQWERGSDLHGRSPKQLGPTTR